MPGAAPKKAVQTRTLENPTKKLELIKSSHAVIHSRMAQ